MHGLIAWFARNGVAANLLMATLIVGGLWSLSNRMILQDFPDMPLRTISVSVLYRGSTPGEMEQAIVSRLEEALYDIEGIKQMDSVATANMGTVNLEIEEGFNMSEKLDEVANRVSAIRTFPPEAERPQIHLRRLSEKVITIILSGDLSEKEMKELGERLRDEVSTLPGITLAAMVADRLYEIAIEVPEATLREYGLTFDQIARAIRTYSVDLSAGNIKTETGRVMLRTNERAYTREDYAAIPLMNRPDGTELTLGEIANVIDGFEETPIVARFNGERALGIDIFRTGDQSFIEIGDTVKDFITRKQEQLPEGIHLSYWRDRSHSIQVRLSILLDSALVGFCLVVGVLSLFLRPTLAFWVACGIPIAFAGSFLLLPYLGVTINLPVILAFITTLGIVVDDAIVTGENVFQHMQRGSKPLSAAIKGTQEVAIPVFFGVITTMAAFYPLFLMTGRQGANFRNIPLVVIPVLLFSLIESKLVLPAHLKHCTHLGDKGPSRNPFTRFQRFFSDGLEGAVLKYYRPSLDWSLKNRYTSISIFVAILLLFVALVLGDRIGYRGRPVNPRDTATISLQMPAGSNFETTLEKVDLIESAALQLKKEVNERFGTTIIQNVVASAGGQPFSGSPIGGYGPASGVDELGEVIIELTPSETREADYGARELVEEMRELVPPIPEAEQLSFSFAGGGSDAVLNFELIHPDVEVLKAASADLQGKLNTFEGLFDIGDSYEQATEEYGLDLKPEAEYLGISASNLAQQVRAAFFGAEAQRIQRGRDEVRVMVRYPIEERRSLGALQTMMIRTADGTEVPFETVAEIVPGESVPSIRRVDRKRIIQVTADGDSEKYDIEAMEVEVLEEFLPQLVATKYQGLEFEVRGRAAETRDNNKEIIWGVYFILAVVYALLAIPFRSYFQPLIVMSAIPFGVVGAIIGHWVMAIVFGWNGGDPKLFQSSMFGMMALCGVVVNDSLVMVHFMNGKVKEGMPLGEAIRLAGVRRFRPILLTSLTTFCGLAPLMLEDSPTASFLIPMAISLGWGILFATTITLILVPVLVLIYDDLKRVFYKVYDIAPHAAEGAVEEEAPG